MLDLGTARGAITLDADGFLQGVGIVKTGVEELGSVGEVAGRGLMTINDHIDNVINSMGKMSGVAKVLDGVAKAMGAIAVTGGVTLIAGGAKAAWDQVRSVQNATSALRAYERDATKVDGVLKGLLEYARSDLGVLFSRQELFAAAQGLKLYGAETGRLVNYVEIMSRSVGLGLSNWDQLGTVIGRVGSTGRLVGNDFDYLTAAGYQLDNSLRNANVTWDQLFDALDKGIPENALEGIAQNIDGLVVRLQSAIRGIGTAFLGVDPDTSRFIEGGLGDKLSEWLASAPALIKNFQGAAAGLGNTIADIAGVIESIIGVFRGLPQPIQSAITGILGLVTAFGALRMAGSALSTVTSIAGFGGIGSLLNGGMFKSGTAGAQGFGAALAGLVGRISPVGVALTALGVVGVGIAKIMGNNKREAEEAAKGMAAYESAVTSLEDTITQATLEGDLQLVRQLKQMNASVEATLGEIEATVENSKSNLASILETGGDGNLGGALVNFLDTEIAQTAMDWARDNTDIPDNIIDEIMSGNADIVGRHVGTINAVMDQYYEAFAPTDMQKADILNSVNSIFDLMGNELVDTTALMNDFNAIWAEFGQTGDVDQLLRDLDELHSATLQIIELGQGQVEYDYLAMLGMTDLAEDIQHLHQLHDAVADVNNELSAGQQQAYGEAWEGIFDAIRSGEYDVDAILGKIRNLNYMLASDQITAEEYAQGIVDISLGLDEFSISADEASVSANELGQRMLAAATGPVEEYNEKLQAVTENLQALMEVAGYGDPLSQWNLSENATQMSQLAGNTQQAATTLDTVFRVVVGNTNAIAQQADGIQQWIDGLMTWSDEQLNIHNLVAEGLVSQQEYNAALEAQGRITEANAQIQRDVLAIQALQAPLIADHTESLQRQLEAIRQLPAEQQLVALGWMDATTAGRAMEFQTLAVAAANGDLGASGADAFAQYATSAAMVDPVLAALLVDMGLLKEITDAETGKVIGYEVTMTGSEEVQSDIDRLTMAVLMLSAQGDIDLAFGIAVDLYGLEEAERMFGRVNAEDGTTVTKQVMIDTSVNVPDTDIGRALSGTGEHLKPLVLQVAADSSNAEQVIMDLVANPPTVTIPVAVQMANVGMSAGSAAAGMASDIFGDSISISVTADTSGWDSALADAMSQRDALDGSEATVSVLADDSAAREVFAEISAATAVVDGLEATVDIHADRSLFDTTISTVQGTRDVVEGWEATVDIHADRSSLDKTISTVEGTRDVVEGWEATVDILGNKSNFDTTVSRVQGTRDVVEGWDATVDILGDKSRFGDVVSEVSSSLEVVRGWSATVSIRANASNVYGTIASLRMQYNGAVVATSYVDIVTRRTGGGIPGFADGGIVRSDVILVGEDGPELVALPYGSEVFSNQQSIQMLRDARANDYSTFARAGSGPSGTQYIDNSTHTTEYVALTESDFQRLLAKSERGNAAYQAVNSFNQYGGGN